jgi:DNA end-binding protein Ku
MSRSTWKGTLSLGLVNIAVEVHTATKDKDQRPQFKQLHECTPATTGKKATPAVFSTIKKVTHCGNDKCAKHAVEIPYADLQKGFEHGKGSFVVMTKEELAAAAVEGSKTLDIAEFVPRDAVPVRFFDTPYFLAPQKGAEKGYGLVREAMRKADKFGVCNATLRENSSHLAVVGVEGDALVLYTMRYSAAVVDPSNFMFPSREVKAKELDMAVQLIENMTDKFEPEKYGDAYGDNLRDIIAKKLKGEKVEVATAIEAPATQSEDLMTKLQDSLKQSKPVKKSVRAKVAA